MSKILIFYGSYGGGHLSAAKNIKDYIENNYPESQVLLVDCIEYINKFLNKITTKAYTSFSKNARWIWKKIYYGSEKGILSKISNSTNTFMSSKLNKLIVELQPDLIISTHPFSSQMCAHLKMKGKNNCNLATVMTDYAAHNQWLVHNQFVDFYFVAHDGMKKDLINRGVAKDKIHVTGIPISSRFLFDYDKSKILQEYELSQNKKTILFFAGGEFGFGQNNTFKILKTIISKFPHMQVIAISGKNAKLKKRFDKLVLETNSEKFVKILSYTNQVPELMSISDFVITKPGGLTTTESLASGLPLILIEPLPGQEVENATFVENNGAGLWIKKDDNIEEILSEAFNNTDKFNRMKQNATLLAKKNSVKDICKTLFKQ